MNISTFRGELREIKALADQGGKILSAVKSTIVGNFKDDLKIQAGGPEMNLMFTFYGLRLTLNVEIAWKVDQLDGCLVAKMLSDTDPKETVVDTWPFDKLGNIGRWITPAEFPKLFLEKIFSKLTEKGVVLKP